MKGSIVIFIVVFISSFCFAQQNIVFEKILDTSYYPVIQKYALPKSVTCTFKDGTKQRLVLEKVKGDSLIFRKYYNQPQNFDCLYSSLQKMKIHKKGEIVLYTLFMEFTVTTLSFVSVAIISDHPPSDAGDPSQDLAVMFALSSAITVSGAILTASYLPKNYKPNKWKLYGK